jgi:type III secretion protein S
MDPGQVVYYAKMAVVLSMDLSMPSIIAASTVGLTVSIVQTVMQLQEQTVSFAIKLFTMVLTFLITGAWMGARLLMILNEMIDSFPMLTR